MLILPSPHHQLKSVPSPCSDSWHIRGGGEDVSFVRKGLGEPLLGIALESVEPRKPGSVLAPSWGPDPTCQGAGDPPHQLTLSAEGLSSTEEASFRHKDL